MDDKEKKYDYKFKVNESKYKKLIKSISSPKLRDWRDIIEDYITISRKRKNNQLAMFYLQTNLLTDILYCERSVKNYKELLEKPEKAHNYAKEKIEINESLFDFWKKEIE